MAERGRFELPIPVKVCLISSQVHSTGLCHLSVVKLVQFLQSQRFPVRCNRGVLPAKVSRTNPSSLSLMASDDDGNAKVSVDQAARGLKALPGCAARIVK